MAGSCVVQARVPSDIQAIANQVINASGLTVSDVVRVMMTRIAQDRAIPLEIFRPNAVTLAAIQDVREGRTTPTTIEELKAIAEAEAPNAAT
ncbi:MAG: type II toxin-antitoxin system RelB/DinJ family antitoxin [Zoogloeaceae bacterium]|jgi:DNA-damage-inducible protein J|nr:type II toxin-antitoxin system RelB/DinJ family antitoxin [Zoogloeaceae bacterium]